MRGHNNGNEKYRSRQKVNAIEKAFAKWSTLEVTANVEEWMVAPLYGKHGKAIKKLSQSMGGIVFKVTDGVCRGRATSYEAAQQGARKLRQRVR